MENVESLSGAELDLAENTDDGTNLDVTEDDEDVYVLVGITKSYVYYLGSGSKEFIEWLKDGSNGILIDETQVVKLDPSDNEITLRNNSDTFSERFKYLLEKE